MHLYNIRTRCPHADRSAFSTSYRLKSAQRGGPDLARLNPDIHASRDLDIERA